jgi:hypothetical protein
VAPSFYEPGGLAVAGDKLYVADTNNHAIRVVDLKTKQTKTLTLKGLQPPQSAETETETTEAPPNQEEIKLTTQKLRTGDVSILVDAQLPPGYHLNPMAPQRYRISIEGGSSLLNIDSQNSGRTLKNATLPIRIPARATAPGRADFVASFTFVYCREDNTGVCRIKTLQWKVPVEITSEVNAPAEISLNAKVAAD